MPHTRAALPSGSARPSPCAPSASCKWTVPRVDRPVVRHQDPDRVVPPHVAAHDLEPRVGGPVGGERSLGVGAVHVRGGVGTVELRDHQVGRGVDRHAERRRGVGVVEVAHLVAPEASVPRPPGGGGDPPRSHPSHRPSAGRRTPPRSCSPRSRTSNSVATSQPLPCRRDPMGRRHPVGHDPVPLASVPVTKVAGFGYVTSSPRGPRAEHARRAPRARPGSGCATARRGAGAGVEHREHHLPPNAPRSRR